MYQIVEDNALFLVVDKSAGVSVHRDTHSEPPREGLFNQLKSDFGYPLWPVHRLDTMTSGLIVLAKSAVVAAEFGVLFESHCIEKYYLALAPGKPLKKQGLIVGDMAKSRGGSYKLLRSRDNPAKTRFVSSSVSPGLRGYLLKPYSGKTHQLRVMMKSIGVPVLGDQRYGGGEADRGYLHAYALSFELRGLEYRYLVAPRQGEQFKLAPDWLDKAGWTAPESLNWGS